MLNGSFQCLRPTSFAVIENKFLVGICAYNPKRVLVENLIDQTTFYLKFPNTQNADIVMILKNDKLKILVIGTSKGLVQIFKLMKISSNCILFSTSFGFIIENQSIFSGNMLDQFLIVVGDLRFALIDCLNIKIMGPSSLLPVAKSIFCATLHKVVLGNGLQGNKIFFTVCCEPSPESKALPLSIRSFFQSTNLSRYSEFMKTKVSTLNLDEPQIRTGISKMVHFQNDLQDQHKFVAKLLAAKTNMSDYNRLDKPKMTVVNSQNSDLKKSNKIQRTSKDHMLNQSESVNTGVDSHHACSHILPKQFRVTLNKVKQKHKKQKGNVKVKQKKTQKPRLRGKKQGQTKKHDWQSKYNSLLCDFNDLNKRFEKCKLDHQNKIAGLIDLNKKICRENHLLSAQLSKKSDQAFANEEEKKAYCKSHDGDDNVRRKKPIFAKIIITALKTHLIKLHHHMESQATKFKQTIHSMQAKIDVIQKTHRIYKNSTADLQENPKSNETLKESANTNAGFQSSLRLLRNIGGLVCSFCATDVWHDESNQSAWNLKN